MENYSLLMGAAAVMKMAVEMAAVSMEEPSGGTSPLRQRAGTETPVPQILASRWRRLWKVSVGFVERIRVFATEALNRRRGGARGSKGCPHHRVARAPPGRAGLGFGGPVPLLWRFSCVLDASGQNRNLGVDFVQFREYFVTRISETKNSRKQELALRHLVNRLVPENP